MPVHTKRLTDSVARKLRGPETPKELKTTYVVHWCPKTKGFGVRVTSAGARTWVAERRIDGKTVRRKLGAVVGRDAISCQAARRAQLDVSSELQHGKDRLKEERERRKANKEDALTFGDALRDYVKNKRRAKDGLPLKQRTRADYLAMLTPAGTTKNGRPTLGGELHDLEDCSLRRITAEQIRELYRTLAARGERRQTYAMQVLRAVLRHHGVAIEGNPLSPTTAGAGRVALAPSRGNPTPIPAARLGAWWRAASATEGEAADLLRFQLITGCRPGEVAAIKAGDVDLAAAQIRLPDTKNRKDHILLLSHQALAIVKRRAKGKRPSALLFGTPEVRPVLAAINENAGVVGITPHKLRHTFASVAAALVPTFTLRRLLNHVGGGDTASVHYVHVSDEQLRAAWQAIADHIEALSGAAPRRTDGAAAPRRRPRQPDAEPVEKPAPQRS